jgi:hypothetical protein
MLVSRPVREGPYFGVTAVGAPVRVCGTGRGTSGRRTAWVSGQDHGSRGDEDGVLY